MCQLNYDGSGTLKFCLECPRYIAFAKSPIRLLLGQEVSFETSQVGHVVEAVDLNPVCEDDCRAAHGISLKHSEMDAMKLTCCPPVQRKRFLDRMLRFQNASEGEQLQCVMEAERLLEILLNQSELDGDAICRLVRKCASWLRPPLLQTGDSGVQTEQSDNRSPSMQPLQLQWRVRNILIRSLKHLDLQDPSTLQALQTAIFYAVSLLNQVEEVLQLSQPTPALKQWLELRKLLWDYGLCSSQTLLQSGAVERGNSEVKMVRGEDPRHQKNEGLGGFAGKCFEPGPKIKALSTTFKGTMVRLRCSECSFTITSSWHFKNPKTLKSSVIGPNTGHSMCQRKLKKRSYWQSLEDGVHVVGGTIANLKYCRHQKILDFCAPCGGQRMCVHEKRKDRCKECNQKLPPRRRAKEISCVRCKAWG